MIYIGDFNAQHPDLSDISPAPNQNGQYLLEYIRRYQLSRWETGGATHSLGAIEDGLAFQRHLTPNHRQWALINKIVKKAPVALHHRPAEYAQSLIDA